jgi:LPS-assembly lipoprotein
MPRPSRPILATLGLLAAPLAASLAGCGFTPLYATPGMTPSLEAIDVVIPHDRVGFLLHEQLDDELAHKAGDPVRYQLVCSTREVRIPRGVRVNNVANRYEINLTVTYTLTEAGGTKVLLHGIAPVIAEYDSADPPYAGVAAEQDGENRAANQAAIAIRLALSRYFAGYHAGSHPVETVAPGDALGDGVTPSTAVGPTAQPDSPQADGSRPDALPSGAAADVLPQGASPQATTPQ